MKTIRDTFYILGLYAYACAFTGVERLLLRIGVMLHLDDGIKCVRKAKEASMLERMEMLVSNIQKCKTYAELKCCEDLLLTSLIIPFPEYHDIYYPIITKSLDKKEEQLKRK